MEDLLKREQDYLDAINKTQKGKAHTPRTQKFESDIDRIIRETKQEERHESKQNEDNVRQTNYTDATYVLIKLSKEAKRKRENLT